MDSQFWSDRVRRHGHTGWSTVATYAYDQRLRIKAVERTVLRSVGPGGARVLDFGCGVGDFCTLLSERFKQVVGYDVSADILAAAYRRNPGGRITYTDQLEMALAIPLDLILSVTVLQHLVDDGQLAAVLARLTGALAPRGTFALMETLAEVPVDAGYLRRRTMAQMIKLFEDVGLVLVEQHDFYHPGETPTRTYARFRGRLVIRILGRLAAWRLPLAARIVRELAERAADADTEYLDGGPSPTKILIFRRPESSS